MPEEIKGKKVIGKLEIPSINLETYIIGKTTKATGLEMRLKTVNGLRSAFSGFAKIANETIERIKETMLKYDAARKFNPIIAKINAVNEFLFP